MKNIENYKKRFYNLMESTMGDVRPVNDSFDDKNVLSESSNGMLPDSSLMYVNNPDGGKSSARLSVEAGSNFNKMIDDAKKDGISIKLVGANSGYRKLGSNEGDWKTTCNNQGFSQWCAWLKYKAGKGNEAAKPGTSNHGMGNAIDVENCERGGKVHNWLIKNSKNYGFFPYEKESWHWNYVKGASSGENKIKSDSSNKQTSVSPVQKSTVKKTEPTISSGGEILKQPAGDPYEYKKTPDGKYYTKKKTSSSWINITGTKFETPIRQKVFKDL
jgi:hypothetical protein